MYSPIVVFAYNRKYHLEMTINALLTNKESNFSDLYIFCDGPKSIDQNDVLEVRNYVKSIIGFNKIHINYRDENHGLAKNVISGLNYIFSIHEKAIIIEDDIVVSDSFLKFMNDLLNEYREEKKIFSISGYNYPIKISQKYLYDIYFFERFSSWGWATWKDRWNEINFDLNSNELIFNNKKLQNQFQKGGKDLYYMLLDQVNNKINSWAIRVAYHCFKEKYLNIYPINTKVNNIGHDNSGTHCSTSNKWSIVTFNISSKGLLPPKIQTNKKISRKLKIFFSGTLTERIIIKLKNLFQ